MSTKVFQEHYGREQYQEVSYGIATDCDTEESFLVEFCSCLTEMAEFHAKEILGKREEEKGDPQALDRAIMLFRTRVSQENNAMVSRAFEIFLKFRGYKSDVKVRRQIYSGDGFVGIDKMNPTYSYDPPLFIRLSDLPDEPNGIDKSNDT